MNFCSRFVKEKLQPIVNTEEQLIFACHLIGPTLNRFNVERPKCISDLAVIMYEMLEKVNHTQSHLKQMDPICDLLYPFSNTSNHAFYSTFSAKKKYFSLTNRSLGTI